MQVKFETKSQRIKGLAFHPIRPWILASLHNGLVQLWDYKIQTLVETFDAHDGPCRGLSFHSTQPLFVTGGDDYLIKVWNYKQRKHQFTLKGHLDYIRTTEFHEELPWIISASDDQTIRIWNYQSRSMLAILTGHSHYVMCARFHPTKDLIVSCSLDQTLRLWDFSAIKNKSKKNSSSQQHDIYGAEVEIIAIMEGHDRGINWCSFHPTLNLISSASDDRKVKLWKFTETKAWEHDSLFGHNSNVSSCAFHPKLDIVVSNSEDKTTRIWNVERRTQVQQVKKDTDRYWISACHPELYLMATGHDSGFEVYSLINEKIPYAQVDQNQLVFSYRSQLKHYDYRSNNISVLKSIESDGLYSNAIVSLNHNNFDSSKNSFILGVKESEKKDSKVLFQLIQYDSQNIKNASESSKQFYGKDAIFIAKSKICRLKDTGNVEVYNIDLDSTSSSLPGLENVSKIFQSTIGKLIVITEDNLIQYDVNSKKAQQVLPLTSELSSLKKIVWNKSNSFVAFICKKAIHIYTKTLTKICSFSEKFNIKSLIWYNNSSILYSTQNHIKFGLLNGDSGILKCTESTLRIVNLDKGDLIVIDSSAKIFNIKINQEELALKSALYEKNWEKTQKVLGSMQKLGTSVVSYLYKKNYAGLALDLVEDKKAQFSLALDSGNLEVAFQVAGELKDKELFKKFSKEAVRQGQMQVWQNDPSVEMAYRQTKEYEKLMFLYLITGQSNKLQAMIQIAQRRNDNQSRFQNALYTGDVQERIKVLSEIGQIQLAYLTAVTHGQTELADLLKNSIENPQELLKELEDIKSTALVPPKPLVRNIKSSVQAQKNWPLNYIPQEHMIATKNTGQDEKIQEIVEEQQQNQLLVDETNDYEQEEEAQDKNNVVSGNFEVQDDENDVEADEWGLEEEELPEEQEKPKEQPKEKGKTQKQDIYKRQENPILRAGKLSQFIGEQTAVGYFEQSFQTMKKQLGIVNYAPLKNVAMKIATYSQICVPQIPFVQSQMNYIASENNKPLVCISLPQLSNMIQQKAYKLFSKGPSKFKETHDTFTEILHSVPFLKLKSQEELKSIQSLIRICVEYIMAIRLQLQAKKEPARNTELIAYMGLCNLQNPHKEITLRQAQSSLYKEKNYIYASYFAKKLIRLLENSDKQDIVNNAKRVLSDCENNGTNSKQLNMDEGWLYDDDFIMTLDGKTLSVIEGNSTKCPFCQVRYSRDSMGQICSICQVGKIGQEVLGLKV